MPFPDTRKKLEMHGYHYNGEGTCRGCGIVLHWYDTPKGKKMPMEVKEGTEEDDEPTLICHFGNCPQGSEFRKKDE